MSSPCVPIKMCHMSSKSSCTTNQSLWHVLYWCVFPFFTFQPFISPFKNTKYTYHVSLSHVSNSSSLPQNFPCHCLLSCDIISTCHIEKATWPPKMAKFTYHGVPHVTLSLGHIIDFPPHTLKIMSRLVTCWLVVVLFVCTLVSLGSPISTFVPRPINDLWSGAMTRVLASLLPITCCFPRIIFFCALKGLVSLICA